MLKSISHPNLVAKASRPEKRPVIPAHNCKCLHKLFIYKNNYCPSMCKSCHIQTDYMIWLRSGELPYA